MTKVSIVVPSYNQQAFIGRTLRSITDQKLAPGTELELIVIDGGSDDGSVDVIKSYQDRLTYWVSEPDNGQTHAINKGMIRATGEIRAYLNSDDLYLPGAIQSVVDAYEADSDADIFHGRCITINEQDDRLEREFCSDIETVADVLDLWQVWFKGRNFVQPEVFWTKRIADKIGLFDESRHLAMDYDYWVRCIVAGARVHHIDKEISAFRIWAEQKSKASQDAANELRDIAIRHIERETVRLPKSVRRQLRGDWVFDEIYSKQAGDISGSGLGPLGRRVALAKILVKNRSLFFSRSFRNHTKRIIFDRMAQTRA